MDNTTNDHTSEDAIVDHVCTGPSFRLVPGSNIQFFDFELPLHRLAATRHHFIEDCIDGRQPLLLVIDTPHFEDGQIIHPATGQALTDEQTISCSGLDGLQAYLGTWIPLPYFRFLGRNAHGQSQCDSGPTNWVRLFLSDPGVPLTDAKSVKAVLAIDTRIAPAGRLASSHYIEPNNDDVLLMSTFIVSPSIARNAAYVGEQWIDQWLRSCVRRSPDFPAASHFSNQYWHTAQYLALIAGLVETAVIPNARFVDSISPLWSKPDVNLDLVIDVSDLETTALFYEATKRDAGGIFPVATLISIRDISEPATLHRGIIPTTIEFDDAGFGNSTASRRSGRNNAFPWPSIARIGNEAQRLSLRASATPGTSGLSGFVSQVMDQSESQKSWRYSREELNKAGQGPVVSGEPLIGLKDDGTRASGGEAGLKPRFSRSSLLGFFFTELLLQALSQINPPRRLTNAATDEGVHRIARIVLATTTDTPDDERELMLRRLRDAVDAVWDGLGWNNDAVAGRRRRPDIKSGLDPDIAAQFVYVFDEITLRFGGNAVNFFSAARKPRLTGAPAPALRVASVRFGSDFSRVALVDYKISNGGTIVPQLSLCERHSFVSGTLLDAVIERHILPAIEIALAHAGCGTSADLVCACADRGGATPGPFGTDFASRFHHRILQPAAQALLDVCKAASPDTVAGIIHFELADLVLAGGGRLRLLAAEFDRHATAAGAKGFALAGTSLAIPRRALSSTLQSCIRPVALRIAGTLTDNDCDLIMLTGNLPALSDVESELMGVLPLAPHRVVNLLHRHSSLLQRTGDDTNIAQLSTQAVGVALASRTSLGATGFNLITSTVEYPGSPTRRQPLIGHGTPSIAVYGAQLDGHEDRHS